VAPSPCTCTAFKQASRIVKLGAFGAARALRSPAAAGAVRAGVLSSAPGSVGFSAESYQHALGDFQLIELIPELRPFGIEPREPFGNPLPLLSNRVHRSHLLYPSSSLDTEDDVISPVFSMEKYLPVPDDYHSEPLRLTEGPVIRWGSACGAVSTSLVRRRLRETIVSVAANL
jgi:hypothetical protein